MPQLKEVLLKINGIKKTKQITKAMNMVAASRLRGAQSNMEAFRPYAAKFAEVLGSLAENAGEEASPLLVPREAPQKVNIVLTASDRGLCGGFNFNLIEKANSLAKEKAEQGMEVSFTCFGKKGRDWARNQKQTIAAEHLGVVGGSFGFNVAVNAGRELANGYLNGDYDEVYVVYAEFIGMAKQAPVIKQLLPIPPIEKVEEEAGDDDTYLAEHICEPSTDALLGVLLPKSIDVKIYSALLETSTSEHAARMMAMDNATKACNDMLDNLQLLYNKARQAAITADLMDIVGGAEALKG
ncbi:MAG: ATP synthase F1 subunit gamma [Desulfobacteraceae bacterium]